MSIPIKKIMVPTDGSPGSVKAARWAADLAASIDAGLMIVHVAPLGVARVDAEHAATGEGPPPMRPQDIVDLVITATLEQLGPVKVPIQQIHAYGDPAKEIVYQAGYLGVDLIVMGSRGLSPFRELLLGSVSDKVARHANIPVTIVH
ncbi:MAG: universal stress protein [Deltaproteobacteria bacterium]|nr:MAG: universal stress protein [Deltaproteobacteria bacterium]